LGVIYFNLKDYPKALSIFKLGLTQSPNDADLYGNIGAAYYNMNKYDSAVLYLRKTLALNPRIVSARENLEKAENILNTIKSKP
jgi:tetratricopeptide (TPR) repeat protein